MQLFADPTIAAGVAGGLAFLLVLKVAAFIAVRRMLKPAPVRHTPTADARAPSGLPAQWPLAPNKQKGRPQGAGPKRFWQATA